MLLSDGAFVKTLQKERVATARSSLESTIISPLQFLFALLASGHRHDSLLFSHCSMRWTEDRGSPRGWSTHFTLTSTGHPQTTILKQLQKDLSASASLW